MPHFSRLTDIVTCNLTEILASAEDPAATLKEVIDEINEGLSACRRTVRSSHTNFQRFQGEIDQHRQSIATWVESAKSSLADGDESAARNSLTRKVELEDLIEGLQPEMQAAHDTWQNMLRIQKALEARQSEAVRRWEDLSGDPAPVRLESETAVHNAQAAEAERTEEVEAELRALRRQIGQ
jgi:phage shock protein A